MMRLPAVNFLPQHIDAGEREAVAEHADDERADGGVPAIEPRPPALGWRRQSPTAVMLSRLAVWPAWGLIEAMSGRSAPRRRARR